MAEKTPLTGFFVGFLGLAAAAGIGYYTWGLYGQNQSLADTSNRSLIEKRLCDDGLQLERQRSAELDKRVVSCTDERAKAQTEKAVIERLKSDLEANLSTSRAELEELLKQRAQTEARLRAFRELTEKFRKMTDTGQIKVLIRDGRMILKLPEGILFASGSAELSDKGKATLQEVATNLKAFPQRNFMVGGHTDDVPPGKGAQYHSNWELSTARAVTVTEFLISAGTRPQQLIAAGYSEYDPVSKTRKQENRRIEIALLPTIDELPQFPEDPATGPGAGDKDKAPVAEHPAAKKTH